MTKTSRFIFILSLIVLIMLGVYLFFYNELIVKRGLLFFVEGVIQAKIEKKVYIERIDHNLLNGKLKFINVRIDSKDVNAKTPEIDIDFSFPKILKGQLNILKIKINSPSVTVDLEKTKTSDTEIGKIPSIDVNNGRLLLLYKDKKFDFTNIQGKTDGINAALDANVLGVKVYFMASKTRSGWKGTLETKGVDLKKIDNKFGGILNTRLKFSQEDKQKTRIYLHMFGENLELPWKKTLAYATIRADATLEKDALVAERLAVLTPVVSLYGHASLSGLDKIEGSRLKFNLLSPEKHPYNDIIDQLPTDKFPAWLNLLLTKQIRDGHVELTGLSFDGLLFDFKDWAKISTRGDFSVKISDMSFGSGHNADRITGISGLFMIKNGNVSVDNISGSIGAAKIKSVDLLFLETNRHGTRVQVDADIAMDAASFLRTWRAAMLPVNVYKFMNPVSNIRGGFIVGQARVFSDSATGIAQIKGNIKYNNLSFSWDNTQFRDVTGTGLAKGLGDPISLNSSGTVSNLYLKKLVMTLRNPLGSMDYDYVLNANAIPKNKAFNLSENTDLFLKGKGKVFEKSSGAISMITDGFNILETSYKTKKSALSAKGYYSADLGAPGIKISGLDIKCGNENLKASIDILGNTGKVALDGKFDLSNLTMTAKKSTVNGAGVVKGNVSLAWGKTSSYNGNLLLDDARLIYKDNIYVLDGAARITNNKLSTSSLKVVTADKTVNISGELLLRKPLYFKGNLTMDGLKIERDQATKNFAEELAEIEVHSTVKLTNIHYYGLVISKFQSTVDLNNGILTMPNLQIEDKLINISGSTMTDIKTNGKTRFDLDVSLKNASMDELSKVFNPNADWVRGTMNLSGHLFGTMDSINGEVKVDAKDGKIKKYTLMSQIFTLLNPYKMFKSQEVDLGRGFSFNHASGTFSIKNSLMSFNDLYVDSNSLQFSGVGTYNLETKYIDGILAVEPLESFDKTIGAIPIVGWILTGNKGWLIVLAMEVKGTADNPTVKLKPVDTVQKPISEAILRALRLPEELILRPQNLILPSSMRNNNPKETKKDHSTPTGNGNNENK